MRVTLPEDVVWKDPFLEGAGFISISKGVCKLPYVTEMKLTVPLMIKTVCFTRLVKCGQVLKQIKCQQFIFQQPRKKIHLSQGEVIKHTRHKTDSEPLSQNLDQLNATLLVFFNQENQIFF